MAFELAAEGAATTETWSVEGSCGERHFELGTATCAVGSEETNYWAVLGVLRHEDGTFDTAVLVHPKEEGSCEVTVGSRSTCSLELLRARTGDPATATETFVMTSGTVTLSRTTGPGGENRITGTFTGTAPELPPEGEPADTLVITAGVFDVELVP